MVHEDDGKRRRSVAGGAGWLPLLAFLALTAAACGDSSTGPESEVPLTVSATASGQFAPASAADAGTAGVDRSLRASPDVRAVVTSTDTAGNELTLERAMVVIGAALLRPEGTDSCGAGGSCPQVAAGPFLLEVPLDGSVNTVGPVGRVPPDVYDAARFQLRLAQASDGAVVDSFPELEGSSVLVQGSYNGSPFTFTFATESVVGLDLAPSLVVEERRAGVNVTIKAEVGEWFVTSEGVLMDPASAAGDVIAASVLQSLTAYPDLDSDGSPDGTTPVGG